MRSSQTFCASDPYETQFLTPEKQEAMLAQIASTHWAYFCGVVIDRLNQKIRRLDGTSAVVQSALACTEAKIRSGEVTAATIPEMFVYVRRTLYFKILSKVRDESGRKDWQSLANLDFPSLERAGSELAAKIETLPQPYHAVAMLMLAGMTELEIADELGLSRDQVKRLKAKLRLLLSDDAPSQTTEGESKSCS